MNEGLVDTSPTLNSEVDAAFVRSTGERDGLHRHVGTPHLRVVHRTFDGSQRIATGIVGQLKAFAFLKAEVATSKVCWLRRDGDVLRARRVASGIATLRVVVDRDRDGPSRVGIAKALKVESSAVRVLRANRTHCRVARRSSKRVEDGVSTLIETGCGNVVRTGEAFATSRESDIDSVARRVTVCRATTITNDADVDGVGGIRRLRTRITGFRVNERVVVADRYANGEITRSINVESVVRVLGLDNRSLFLGS